MKIRTITVKYVLSCHYQQKRTEIFTKILSHFSESSKLRIKIKLSAYDKAI